ncbi:MAG: hypothetical protein ACREC5_01700 [Thermoplasmata archaeon]
MIGGLFVVLLITTALAPPLRASAAPMLPPTTARGFLPRLGIGAVAPGASAPLQFALADPLARPVANVSLTFAVYAFNPAPGTGAAALPAEAPTLSDGNAASESLTIPVGTLGAGATNWSAAVTVAVPSGAPLGSYSIRDLLRFDLGGSTYWLESIGNFPAALWHNATVLPNGTPTLNLSRLGVSGVLPETAVLVTTSTGLDLALYALLGAAGLFALAGVYVAGRRRGPSSSAGIRASPPPSQAPTALGKSRRSDGD